MAETPQFYEAQTYIYKSLEEANRLLPVLSKRFVRISQMNALLHQLLKDARNQDYLFNAHEVSLSQDMEPTVLDAVSSIKLLLASIQKELDRLSQQGIRFKSIDQGIAVIPMHHADRVIHLLWQAGDARITHWEESESAETARHPVEELELLEESVEA